MGFSVPAASPTPARVHADASALIGHRACWLRPRYSGGIWRRDHFRICSFCGSIHPRDLLNLLAAGGSELEPGGKPGKWILISPNPIAGHLGRMGSMPGRIFDQPPRNLRERLISKARPLEFSPSMQERLSGHFDRPSLEIAPEMIAQPFFENHASEPQWAEIRAAARNGADK